MGTLYTWKENVELIITRAKKIRHFSKIEENKFRAWLIEKDGIGNRFFNVELYLRAWSTYKKLRKDYDDVTVVVGLEGLGKSTQAIQYCSVVSDTFSLKHICYEMSDFVNAIKIANKYDSILLDEGGMFLFSRDAMSANNKILVKLLMLSRQKNLHICIAIPQFTAIEKYIREHRVTTLINVYKRGKNVTYIDKAIKIISEILPKKKDFSAVKVPNGTFVHGYFAKVFPTMNDISHETYKQFKEDHLNRFISDIETETVPADAEVKKEYIPGDVFRKRTGVKQRQFSHLVTSGRLKGRKFGGKWFVHISELE